MINDDNILMAYHINSDRSIQTNIDRKQLTEYMILPVTGENHLSVQD